MHLLRRFTLLLAAAFAVAACGEEPTSPLTPDGSQGPVSGAEVSEYDFQVIADELDGDPVVNDINNRGQVVGFEFFFPTEAHGFVWDNGQVELFDFPGADFTFGNGINDVGSIAGHHVFGPPDLLGPIEDHGFVETRGTFDVFDFPSHNSWAFDVSNRGDLAGTYCEEGAIPGCLNDGAEVQHGYVMTKDGFTTVDPPGSLFTIARSISERGDVVGQFFDGGFHGFLLDKHGNYTTIDVPGALGSLAYGINSRGDIVGEWFGPDFLSHGFVLTKQGEFVTVDFPGALHSWVTGINDRGDLCGNFLTDIFELKGFVAIKK